MWVCGVRWVASVGSPVLLVAVTTAVRCAVQLAGAEILALEPTAWVRASVLRGRLGRRRRQVEVRVPYGATARSPPHGSSPRT